MKLAVVVCGSRPRIILMVALLMGAALLALPGAVPVAEAQACCQVTAVSGKSASAVDTKTKTTFEFTVTTPVSLRVGDAVYANFPKKEVSCDGRSICGTITSITPLAALTPVTPKIEGTTEADARTTPTIPPKAEPEVPGCRITAINARTGEVSARETATGRAFTFAVSDARLRNFLKVGQGVHANFDAKEVSLDGKSVVGRIVSLAPPLLERAPLEKVPVLIPPKGTEGSSAASVVTRIPDDRLPRLPTSGSTTTGSASSGSTAPTGTAPVGNPVCAGSSTLQGVDVSDSAGTVNWKQVQASGRTFAYAKATAGNYYTDPTFQTNYAAIKAAGLVRGAYHVFDPTASPVDQANYFLAALSGLGPLQPGDLPPALSVMLNALNEPQVLTVPVSVFQEGIGQWMTTVQAATGRTPIVYIYSTLFQDLGSSLSADLLWIADSHPGDTCPLVPAGSHQWVFWQYSLTGTVPGTSSQGVDLDVFNGSLADLNALTKP